MGRYVGTVHGCSRLFPPVHGNRNHDANNNDDGNPDDDNDDDSQVPGPRNQVPGLRSQYIVKRGGLVGHSSWEHMSVLLMAVPGC